MVHRNTYYILRVCQGNTEYYILLQLADFLNGLLNGFLLKPVWHGKVCTFHFQKIKHLIKEYIFLWIQFSLSVASANVIAYFMYG